MSDWAAKWKMEFNVKKCKVTHFGTGNEKFDYSMNGTKLEATHEERDIGVLVSDNLKPSSQCAKAAKTATTVLDRLLARSDTGIKRYFGRCIYRYVMSAHI
jgi:hypothetical protein